MIDQQKLEQIVSLMRTIGTDVQRFEVKATSRKLPKSIAETLSAFSNGNGGTIILGLSEADGFTPTPGFRAKSIQDAISNVCDTKLTPPVRPQIAPVPFEGSTVVVVEIDEMHPFDKPCYITERGKYQGAFIRTGDGDRHLSGYEVDRLIEEHRQPRYDAEVVEEATLEDLDQTLVQGLLARERDTHASVFGKLGDEDALINLRVIAEGVDHKLHPTLGGLLALGTFPQKYFPRLCVTFAAFPGSTKAAPLAGEQRLLDSETIVGPIGPMIKAAVAAVRRNSRTGSLIEGEFRADMPDYPPVAIREAVANALMHRDYSPLSRGTQVQVNLYADRLEILNPGGLFGTVTIDQLGKSGVSSTRNQHLATILESTPYEAGRFVVENRGTGYQEIESRLREARLPGPIPRDSISYFSIVFPRRRIMDSELAVSTKDMKSAISDMIAEQGSASTKEIMAASGLSRARVLQHIRQLIEEGAIEPLERSRSPRQRYRIKSKDSASEL